MSTEKDWYIDNNRYISEEFLKQIIECCQEALRNKKRLKSVLKEKNPSSKNPSSQITFSHDMGMLLDENLTDASLLYDTGVITYSDFTFLIASKRNVLKLQTFPAKPLVIISKFFYSLLKLETRDEDLLLTIAECKEYLSPIDTYEEYNDQIAEKVLNERTYTDEHIPSKRASNLSVYWNCWFTLIASTGVFKFLNDKNKDVITIDPMCRELIEYLATEGEQISSAPIDSKELNKYYSDIGTGFFEILPDMPNQISNIPIKLIGNFYEYIFGVDDGDYFPWDMYFEKDFKGLFRIFFPVQNLVISKIYSCNTVLGEGLYYFVKIVEKYLKKIKEGKLMITRPFDGNIPDSVQNFITQYSCNNNEQAFRDWMGQQKKDNGELYADTTIGQECSRIKNVKSKDSIKDIMPCENLFVIDDAESIDKVRKELESKVAADELARNEADGLPNALNFYYKFLLWKHNRISFETNFSSDKQHNRIIFGAPGTGKSHKLEEERKALLGKSNGSYERVTFHPDYSYAQFVGTYKPVSYGDEDNKKIKYEFVPGPFTRVLVKALKNCIHGGKAEPYLLIIEELNRAKTAAVFGDVFQLLDRKNGVSEYEIETSQDLREYLAYELAKQNEYDEPSKELIEEKKKLVANIKIPNNMFIWATMNSADQGVFPLDTAFKRRWSFEYLPIDCEEKDKNKLEFSIVSADGAGNNETIYWDELRRAINHHLSGNSINAREDKLLGSYYIQCDKEEKESFKNGEDYKNYENEYNKNCTSMFCDKVLMYLFEDVVKTHRDRLFATKEYNRFSEIRNDFIKNGVNVFVKAITDEYGELTKGYGKKDESKTE